MKRPRKAVFAGAFLFRQLKWLSFGAERTIKGFQSPKRRGAPVSKASREVLNNHLKRPFIHYLIPVPVSALYHYSQNATSLTSSILLYHASG
jgi:hypothetical protein